MMLNDIQLLENASRIEIKRFKKHDKVSLYFNPPSKLAKVMWRFRTHVEDIPDSDKQLREKILEKLSNQSSKTGEKNE